MPVMREVLRLEDREADERLADLSGIDVVRNRIKGFAQKKVTLPPGRHKIIILDEADRWAVIWDLESVLRG